MKKSFKNVLTMTAVTTAIVGVAAIPSLVSAWGPDRPTYSIQQVAEANWDKPTFNSIVVADTDYAWHKQANGVEIPSSTILDERNFVGARENTGVNAGGANKWYGNDIVVENGKEYIIRMYVHNNMVEKEGQEAKSTAKDVRAKFFLPSEYNTKQIINGQISASNTMYEKYWDYVNFVSKDGMPFKVELVKGSANLENNFFPHTTTEDKSAKLGDEIVTSDNGVLIGDGAAKTGNTADGLLDGEIRGCYNFSSYIGIKVKVTYLPFTVEKGVRFANSTDKTWQKTINAKVGDTVEYYIMYRNVSNLEGYTAADQTDVVIKDVLPKNMRLLPETVRFKYNDNGTIKEMKPADGNALVNTGINVGKYTAGSNVIFYFQAQVVDNNLACGSNTLVNWGQAGVYGFTKQDYARVVLNKFCETKLPTAGPEALAGGIIAAGSIATAAGYYVVSRRELRRR